MTEVCSPQGSGSREVGMGARDHLNESMTSVDSGDDANVEEINVPRRRAGRVKNKRMSAKRKALHINFSPSAEDTSSGQRQQNPSKITKVSHTNFGHISERAHQFSNRPWSRIGHRQKNFFKRAKPWNSNNFLLGGNPRDPLNLFGLMENGSRGTTPATSPHPRRHPSPGLIPIPKFRAEDPLNLLSGDDALPPPLPTAHPRKHKRRRRDSSRVGDVEAIAENERKTRQKIGHEFYLESLSDTEVAVMHSPPSEAQKKGAKKESTKPGSPLSPSTPPPQKRGRLGSNAQRSSGGRREGYDPIVSPVPQRSVANKPASPLKQSPVLERKPFHHHHHTPDKRPAHPKKSRPQIGPKKEAVPEELNTSDSTNPKQKSKKDPSRFRYGNYNQYYGKRLPNKSDDPRLSFVDKEWIRGKRVLDIGCNIGHVTLTLARDMAPFTILGIDIDQKLIGIARKNVRHYMDQMKYRNPPAESSRNHIKKEDDETQAETRRQDQPEGGGLTGKEDECAIPEHQKVDISKFPPSFAREYGPLSGPTAMGPSISFSKNVSLGQEGGLSSQQPACESDTVSPDTSNPCTSNVTVSQSLPDSQAQSSAPGSATTGTTESKSTMQTDAMIESDFPRNIVFRTENFVLESDELLSGVEAQYDTVIALSVTKWVHLNWGDPGIKRFFKRIFRSLRPGGRLILEPQPWEGYNKRKKLSPEIRQNYLDIRMKPDQFQAYLLGPEVGFQSCKFLGTPPSKAKGFERPIQLYVKGTSLKPN